MGEKRKILKNFLYNRQHPVKIIGYISKVIWIMIIPVVKNILAEKFDLEGFLRTHILDFIFIAAILSFALFRWVSVYYEIEEDGIVSHSGPLGIRKTKVYFNEITTFSTSQNYFYRLVNACSMYIETNSDSLPQTDIKLVLSERCIEDIKGVITKQCQGNPSFSVSPKRRHVLAYSILFSSPVSGIVLYGMFIYELYRLAGKELEKRLLSDINNHIAVIDSRLLNLSKYIPRAILIFGFFVGGCWILSFLVNLLGYWNFTAVRCNKQFIITSGILTKRCHVLNREKVNFYDFRQSLIMKLFRMCSVSIYCTGYGKRKYDTPSLIPITTLDEMNTSIKILVPSLPKRSEEISTGKADVFRFISLPLVLCFVPFTAGTLIKHIIDRWHTEINIIMTVSIIPVIWFLIVRICAMFMTSAGMKNGYCTLRYCHFYGFHTILIPKENISKIIFSQNIFQKRSHTCTLKVYSNSERKKHHTIRSLSAEKVKAMCQREGYMI